MVCVKEFQRGEIPGALQAKYDAATDLNAFFSSLSPTDAEKYRSEDYNVICGMTGTLFNTYYAAHPQDQAVVDNALTALRDL